MKDISKRGLDTKIIHAGQHIDTLSDGIMSAGNHSTVWRADAHATGVYVAVIKSRNMTDTRKLTFVK